MIVIVLAAECSELVGYSGSPHDIHGVLHPKHSKPQGVIAALGHSVGLLWAAMGKYRGDLYVTHIHINEVIGGELTSSEMVIGLLRGYSAMLSVEVKDSHSAAIELLLEEYERERLGQSKLVPLGEL